MNTQIRPAVPADLPAVNRLLQEVLRIHHQIRPDLFRPEGKKYSDPELLALFADPDTPVFVYEEDGAVLGYVFCQLKRQDSGSLQPLPTLYIDDLCVDPDQGGKGIGTALYQAAVAFARKRGCHNLTLHLWEGNDRARAFYEHMGLKPQYTSLEVRL